MSLYHLSIGDASDPKFHWDNGNYGGNIPKIILNLGSADLIGSMFGAFLKVQLMAGKFSTGNQAEPA